MKLRGGTAPLVLLLVPLASALSAAAEDNIQSTLTRQLQNPTSLDPNSSPLADLSKPKYDVGTKDAPVDGKDGKPHAGPFVGAEKDTKLTTATENPELTLATLKEDKAELVAPGGGKIPPVNDGVMDDPARQLPKEGTTGTEGGVSEKDKVRKAQEGQTGGKVEKTPNSPKEAPPLPVSEESKIKTDKSKGKDDEDDAADTDGLAGLEVSFHWEFTYVSLTNCYVET